MLTWLLKWLFPAICVGLFIAVLVGPAYVLLIHPPKKSSVENAAVLLVSYPEARLIASAEPVVKRGSALVRAPGDWKRSRADDLNYDVAVRFTPDEVDRINDNKTVCREYASPRSFALCATRLDGSYMLTLKRS